MPGDPAHPTDYGEINGVLEYLLFAVRTILGPRFVGLYLDGSLAIGDFHPDRSDIDFVVVTDGELSDDNVLALKAMHARIAAEVPKWGSELEGSYIPRRALQGHDPQPGEHPYIDRGTGSLDIVRHESGYWVIHRHMLREHGVTVAGPDPLTLIDPVGPGELRQAVLSILREWWMPMLANPAPLERSLFGYRCYAILTMCRMLYTMDRGTVVTKSIAADWALETLDHRWHTRIHRELAWSRELPPAVNETMEFIRYTHSRCQQLGDS
jgi:hypothetical protein